MTTGTEEYYRQRAREYDRIYDKPERQGDLAALRPKVASLLAGRHVLEVAAGTGWWTDAYADGAAEVLATDFNPETLAVASARREWPETVRFAAHDAFSLDGLDGAFDAAFVGFFWSHVPLDRLDRFLAGLAGRITGHGLIVFMDNRYVEGSNYPITSRDDQGNTYQRRSLDDGTQWDVLKNFPSPADLQDRLGPFGRRVEVEELTHYWLAILHT